MHDHFIVVCTTHALVMARTAVYTAKSSQDKSKPARASLLQRGVVISWLHHQLELELRLAQACTLHVLTQEVNHSRRLRLVFYGVANFAVAAQNGPVSLEIACSSSIPAQPQAMCSLLLHNCCHRPCRRRQRAGAPPCAAQCCAGLAQL